MESASSPQPETAGPAWAAADELIHQLVHDLRQPLSGIEASAWYIDMVASEARPELIPHCRRLRAMVQQANWLLDDAALCAGFRPGPWKMHSLAELFASVQRKLFEEEEAALDLDAGSGAPPVWAPEALPRLAEHVIAFFRDAAACPDPVHVRLEAGPGAVAAIVWSDACDDPESAARLLAPEAGRGFLGRFLQAAGGEARAEVSPSGRLTLVLRLPAAAEQRA
jgi:signal transduction histidine kinase